MINKTISKPLLSKQNPKRNPTTAARGHDALLVGREGAAVRVDVHGAGFRASDANSNLRCKFSSEAGVALTEAPYHNGERISCFSPGLDSNLVATLEVSFDEQHYTSANSSFRYYTLQNASATAEEEEAEGAVETSVAISSVHPTGGPARGGTILTLHGRGFVALDSEAAAEEAFRNRQLLRSSDAPYAMRLSMATGQFLKGRTSNESERSR